MKLYLPCILAFAISFALPALDSVQPSAAFQRFIRQGIPAENVPSGAIAGHEAARRVWEALRVAWREDRSVSNLADPVIWNLPNACFATMLLVLLLRLDRVAALLGTAAVAAAAYWPLQRGMLGHLGWGYWLWAGSMGAAALLTWMRLARAAR
jgi:hypothetical protein